MDKQTWEKEASVSKLELRSALLEMACSLNQENCTRKARALFKQYAQTKTNIGYVKHTRNVLLIFVWVTVANIFV